jgi:hypothetical protein
MLLKKLPKSLFILALSIFVVLNAKESQAQDLNNAIHVGPGTFTSYSQYQSPVVYSVNLRKGAQVISSIRAFQIQNTGTGDCRTWSRVQIFDPARREVRDRYAYPLYGFGEVVHASNTYIADISGFHYVVVSNHAAKTWSIIHPSECSDPNVVHQIDTTITINGNNTPNPNAKDQKCIKQQKRKCRSIGRKRGWKKKQIRKCLRKRKKRACGL